MGTTRKVNGQAGGRLYGIPIVERDDRAQQIIDDPDTYFRKAQERAAEQVERDMEYEREEA